MIILSFFVISGVTKCGIPVAQIIISAQSVNSSRLGVRELQTVTVAPAFIHRRARGFPTILLLPIITIFFHESEILYSENSFITPAGVHGANQLSFHIIIFH
jgi:hypothetical protein